MRFVAHSVPLRVLLSTLRCSVEGEVEQDGRVHDLVIVEEDTGKRRDDLVRMRTTKVAAEAALVGAARARRWLK